MIFRIIEAIINISVIHSDVKFEGDILTAQFPSLIFLI